jgi:putative ABC transport system substrate-binding protein
MRRREFLGVLVSLAVGWPLAAPAQQPATPVIGYLHSGSEANAKDVPAFRRGLSEVGFVEGRNVAIEFRWGQDRPDLLPALAAELVRKPVNVLFTIGGVTPVQAAKRATSAIPIVFTHGSDPVSAGLVDSFNRPGGNVTGVSMFHFQLTAKRLELLREVLPKAAVIAVPVNPKSATGQAGLEARVLEVQQAARALGWQVRLLNAASPTEIEAAFTSVDQQPADALFMIPDPMLRAYRDTILQHARRRGMPTMMTDRDSVQAGALMSYGVSIPDVIRQAGVYVGRVLKGEKPADLPVLLPTKFELLVNAKTAKELGLTIPLTLQASADELIE